MSKTGSFMSVVTEVDNLTFVKPTSRPVKAESVVRVNDMVVTKLENGQVMVSVYIDRYGVAGGCRVPGDWVGQESTFKALTKLGVLTEEQADTHLEFAKACVDSKDPEWDIKQLKELGEKYDLDVSDGVAEIKRNQAAAKKTRERLRNSVKK